MWRPGARSAAETGQAATDAAPAGLLHFFGGDGVQWLQVAGQNGLGASVGGRQRRKLGVLVEKGAELVVVQLDDRVCERAGVEADPEEDDQDGHGEHVDGHRQRQREELERPERRVQHHGDQDEDLGVGGDHQRGLVVAEGQGVDGGVQRLLHLERQREVVQQVLLEVGQDVEHREYGEREESARELADPEAGGVEVRRQQEVLDVFVGGQRERRQARNGGPVLEVDLLDDDDVREEDGEQAVAVVGGRGREDGGDQVERRKADGQEVAQEPVELLRLAQADELFHEGAGPERLGVGVSHGEIASVGPPKYREVVVCTAPTASLAVANSMDFCFFLIGFKEFNKPLANVGSVSCYCGNCHNQSAHAIRTINCVTLFFIPVLPFYYSKRLKCSICNATGDLSSDAIARLQQGQPVAIG